MSLFAGVRFALLGFDPVSDAQYRSELALHGGADAGGSQDGCTHLVVSGLVHDDPACVAARKDGTKVVTALWVDDCLDLGAMADADHVLYRPLRDLEGIPGAESLCICLTGYLRQNGRESIMKMVNMMGAQFSKPLTAKRVTHLVCYKFEGEKYELAKAVKINTINHHWLEDCLKAWDILPVDNYTSRSGWELEIMEAEAKDSEDEAESADRGLFDSRGIARIIPAMEIAMRTPADLDGHIPNHGPSVFSGNAEVPAGTHVGTSQQIREVKDASEWSVDVTVDTLSTPNTNFVTVSANPDGHTPVHGPTVFTGNADAVVPAGRRLETSQQIREAEEVSKMSLDVRADRLSTPNTNVVTIPDDPDAHAHASQVDQVRTDRLSTPNTNVVTIPADPDAHAHASQVDKVRADRLSTPNTNVVTISADPDAHANASQVDKVRADRLSTPNTNVVIISADPDAHAHASQVDKVRADRLSTPNTNVVTISADPDAHAHASQVDKVEVEAADSEHDKLVFHATFEAGPKEIPITAVPGEYEIFPHKVSTSSARNPGAKRSRTPEDETAAISVHGNCDFAASKFKHDKVLPNGSVEADLEKNCSLNTVESTTILPGEISSRARNTVAKRPLNANSEMNDAIVVYKMKPANVNMEENPTTGARPTAGKTKRVSFDLSFHEAVNAEGSTSKVSSSASADNPETCSPIRVLKPRRKTVAKRKRASSSKEGRSGSEGCRTVSALSEASKSPAESSTNAGKVTVYKDVRNRYADEALEDRPEDLRSSKPRSSKRQKTDHNNKENIPANASLAPKPKHGRKRLSSECVRIAVESNDDATGHSGMTGGNDDGSSAVFEPEPTWFMLSGYRLLRKQCRSILLRLKGRVCSHSHHWSFQATHFITPELRRTEKFFAAAAAGRWILKPEYLFACEEAGKLVDAEPFEWHGDGLNDTHTISLDAPRKWRHLKQRTGHGAFYGMRIIIYGECISPSRDTLRRAVRAGDGTVVATAPPYTRFLKPGTISFAVVAAGTPSSSAWVQEFKRHGVPCVSPSYLVDLVCKPGHLELHKHILFGMQELADESLRKLPPSADQELEGGDDADQSCAMVVVHESEGPISCVAADAAEIASA